MQSRLYVDNLLALNAELVKALDELLRVDCDSERGYYRKDRTKVQDNARALLAKVAGRVDSLGAASRTPQQEQELDVMRSRGEI